MLRALLAASAFSILLTVAGTAAAVEGPWVPKAQGSRIGVDFDWWQSGRYQGHVGFGSFESHTRVHTAHFLTWNLIGQIQLARVAYLDLDVPWAVFDSDPLAGQRTFVFGNPTAGAHWADTFHNRVALLAGGALSVSTVMTGESSDIDNTGGKVSAGRAYADLHRFLHRRVVLRGRSGIELRILPVLFYRVDLNPILAIPVTHSGGDADFSLELHNEIEARASFGLGGGLHLQAVFMSASIQSDAAQLAMEPYVVYEPVRGFYARAGVLVALDTPLGFGFDQGKVATIRIGLGGKW